MVNRARHVCAADWSKEQDSGLLGGGRSGCLSPVTLALELGSISHILPLPAKCGPQRLSPDWRQRPLSKNVLDVGVLVLNGAGLFRRGSFPPHAQEKSDSGCLFTQLQPLLKHRTMPLNQVQASTSGDEPCMTADFD